MREICIGFFVLLYTNLSLFSQTSISYNYTTTFNWNPTSQSYDQNTSIQQESSIMIDQTTLKQIIEGTELSYIILSKSANALIGGWLYEVSNAEGLLLHIDVNLITNEYSIKPVSPEKGSISYLYKKQ